MTQKQQWAEDWVIKNKELNNSGDGVFSMTEVFLAGFEFAKMMCTHTECVETLSDQQDILNVGNESLTK